MDLAWHDSIVNLFEELADEAQLRSTLHMKQHIYYRTRNQWFTLPIVVLSVLSGSGNFISEGFNNVVVKKYLILGIGVVSIFTSVISAVSHHLKLAELSEANRISSLSWGKFYSRLKFKLSLQRQDRDGCQEFMNSIFAEYERLYEISPILINSFVKKIKQKLKKRNFDNGFILPFYMNGFHHLQSYVWEDNSETEDRIPEFEV